ncbi:MAG: GNAT family N-acetyltransferase [Anaerolineales bacterium]|nr:GNAT family N-acetyltransferase [Anaerolineales bacterium]
MQVNLLAQIPAVVWPQGVSLRSFEPQQDERPVYALIQTAFCQHGRRPQPFEDWKVFMIHPDLFDPDLCFLAIVSEEIVGACLCVAYSDLGWVRQLGVEEAWRRKGIGSALLHKAFSEFKGRGYDKVGLSVVSERPTAYNFYKNVGMDKVRQSDEYKQPFS